MHNTYLSIFTISKIILGLRKLTHVHVITKSKRFGMKNYIIGSLAGIRAGFVCNPFEFVKHRHQFQEELTQVKTHNNHAQKVLNNSKPVVTPHGKICHWQQCFRYTGLYNKNKAKFGCLPYKPHSDNFIILPYFFGIVNGIQPQRKVETPVLQRIINVNNWSKVRTFYDKTILPTFRGTFIGGVVNPRYMSQTQFRLQQSLGKYADIYRHYCKSLWGYLSDVITTIGFAGLWGEFNAPQNFIGSSSQLASRSTDMILQYEIFQKSALLTSGVSRLLSGIVTVGAMGPVDCVTKRLLFSQGYEGCPFTNQMRKLSLHGINWTNAYSLVKPGFAQCFYWNICGIAKRIAMR